MCIHTVHTCVCKHVCNSLIVRVSERLCVSVCMCVLEGGGGVYDYAKQKTIH